MGAEVTGAALLAAWCDRIDAGETPGCYPVALAVNFAVQGLQARDAFVVHQYGVAAMILSAALRLMKIGHVETQRMLYRAQRGCGRRLRAWQLARVSPTWPASRRSTEILAAVHVKAHVRLFMN